MWNVDYIPAAAAAAAAAAAVNCHKILSPGLKRQRILGLSFDCCHMSDVAMLCDDSQVITCKDLKR